MVNSFSPDKEFRMIKGATTVSTKSKMEIMLEELHSLPFDFHLTGSRYFKVNTDKSDWDFICLYDENIAKRLSQLNFSCDVNSNYKDKATILVMRWYDERGRNIDIQLTDDKLIDIKLKAQTILRDIKINKPSDEQWDLVISLLIAGKINL